MKILRRIAAGIFLSVIFGGCAGLQPQESSDAATEQQPNAERPKAAAFPTFTYRPGA
jgi:PBP1b-binding outer membrane lipoprotein LpoB